MKHKYKATPPHNWVIFCIIFCILWTSTPVSGSVQDNLQSAIAKILGQKNETTNEANFNNASTNAKLNYLNSKMSSLETKVEVSGVPHLAEVGTFGSEATKTFTGTGELYVFCTDIYTHRSLVVDGIAAVWDCYEVNSTSRSHYRVPFHDQCSIGVVSPGDHNTIYYAYYKY